VNGRLVEPFDRGMRHQYSEDLLAFVVAAVLACIPALNWCAVSTISSLAPNFSEEHSALE